MVDAAGVSGLVDFYYQHGGWRREDIKTQALESSSASRELGWHATQSPDDGILRTFEWYDHLFKTNAHARNLWLAEKAPYLK